jgi:RNA polymerase sigma-70 factor (ECF subfamily)
MTREEFETAVMKHRPDLVQFALSELGDLDVAEDMAQQTFLELFETYEQFDMHGLASVKTWFVNRLKSRCVDERRRRTRHFCEPFQLQDEEGDQEPEDEYEDKKDKDKRNKNKEEETSTIQLSVRKALTKLPEEFRGAAIACLIGGQTQEEAGASLGLSRDQIARKLARAKAFLAKELADYRPTSAPSPESEVA